MHRDDEIEARQNGRKTADKDADACCYHVRVGKCRAVRSVETSRLDILKNRGQSLGK